MDFPVMSFLKNVLFRSIIILLLSISLPLFIRNIMDENIIRLFILSLVTLIWSISVVFLFGLNKQEKRFISNNIRKFIDRVS
jgi:ABC-type bacteriocin/lantibiotic exporter with double-glycine peptidase domain